MSDGEQHKDLNAYLSYVRHELRNPLNTIIGYCELLLEIAEEKGEEDMTADLRRIHTSSQQLHELIGALLDPARIGPGMATESRPQVRGEDSAQVASEATIPFEDLVDITLPQSLYAALEEATETHNVTEVKKCLDEVEALGEEGRLLVAHLRPLVQRFDMDAIKIVLEAIDHE